MQSNMMKSWIVKGSWNQKGIALTAWTHKSSRNSKSDECYNTFEGVNFCFNDEFGRYDEDDSYNDFIESLEEKDFQLTKKETTLLKEYLTSLIDDIAAFEEGEYNPEDIVCDYWLSDGLDDTDYCSYGEKTDENG